MASTPGLVGRALNDTYRLLELVGEGGFADVFLGRDLRTNVPVAVKVLHDHLGRDQAIVARFLHEARIAQQLSDSHIVKVLDFGLDGDVHYIIMEYVTGHTLAHLLKANGPMPVDQAVNYTSQVLLALGDAHQHGIVHRDIKPQNIMVTASGPVKVMDFGISKDLGSDAATSAGLLVGTPRYMSPEQARGDNATAASDIYAVTVTFYELLRGQPPFNADTAWKILNLHASAAPPPIADFRSDVPDHIQRIIAKGLVKDPTQRFATAREMLSAFQRGPLDTVDDKTMMETRPVEAIVTPRPSETLVTVDPPLGEPETALPTRDPFTGRPESLPKALDGRVSDVKVYERPAPDPKVVDPKPDPVEVAPVNSSETKTSETSTTPAKTDDAPPVKKPLSADVLEKGLPKKRSSLPYLIGGGVIIAVLLVGGIILAGGNGPTTTPTPTPGPANAAAVASATRPAEAATIGPIASVAAAIANQESGTFDTAGFPTSAGRTGDFQFTANQGVYQMSIDKPRSWYVVTSKPSVGDMSLAVDAQLTDANAKGSYLVVFRADTLQNCYIFDVNPVQGTFSLIKRINGVESNLISPTTLPAMNRGDAVNHLAVTTRGATIGLAINGSTVATIDDPAFTKGHVGLGGRAATTAATIKFSHLQVGSAGQ